MHAARSRRLLAAVEALVSGRRLTLTDLARSWPGAVWVHAPLKALDRLLSNRLLHGSVMAFQQAMAKWLLPAGVQAVVLVDWADLKGDGRWAVLRASVPVGGRALTLYEQIFPLARMGQPKAQREFLQQLRRVMPKQSTPIIVTDAGFRSDWLRAVQALGWDYIGRLRNNTQVRSEQEWNWRACTSLHSAATAKVRDLGEFFIVKGDPLACRLVLAQRARKGRDQLTRKEQPEQSRTSKNARKAAREPWLLVTSLRRSTATAKQIVDGYARRMQIEEAFRDLKSHRYGAAFEDSLTRKPERLTVLLLLQTLASFAAWLMGLAARHAKTPDPMTRQLKHQRRYSLIRRGLAWLRRIQIPPEISPLLVRQWLAELSARNTFKGL
jgi:hypothetical protein